MSLCDKDYLQEAIQTRFKTRQEKNISAATGLKKGGQVNVQTNKQTLPKTLQAGLTSLYSTSALMESLP